MRGGSFADRLKPADAKLEHLQRLGLPSPLKPLSWRQKLRIMTQVTPRCDVHCDVAARAWPTEVHMQYSHYMTQAVDALLYLNTPVGGGKGAVLHRDFKPDNILLDENLNAFLADTGVAKSEQSGEAAKSTCLVLTYGYLDPSITGGGTATAATDGFAVGITLLVVITGRSPLGIIPSCEEEFNCEFEELDAATLTEAKAGWPAGVVRAIAPLVLGRGACLCHRFTRKRLPLEEVLSALSAIVDGAGAPPTDEGSAISGSEPPGAAGASSAVSVAPALTALTLQVREQRRAALAEDEEASVQRNVSEAFDNFIRRLNQVYRSRAATAPSDFEPRLRYWRDSCGLPTEVHRQLQLLRVWRNASAHHDLERWRRDGPRSVEDASLHLVSLGKAVDALASRTLPKGGRRRQQLPNGQNASDQPTTSSAQDTAPHSDTADV